MGGSVPAGGASYKPGQIVKVLPNIGNLAKAGSGFHGWNTLATGNGTTYTSGQTFVMGSTGVTLYALWSPATIRTVAGTGTAGYSGDGGAAVAAKLSTPRGVAVDASGNIYISDYGNNRIRKVSVGTGIITTVAGTGMAGYSGDNGPATSAKLNGPRAITLDASSNLYIPDSANNRIRKVAVGSGTITTVAGTGMAGYSGDNGPATSAKLNQPYGVAVDASGNLYISDDSNNCIRKVAVGSGIITTVAGTGTAGYSGDGGPATAAELNQPYGVAVDASGNFYIGDAYNNCIRMVAAGSGIITTVAGNGTAGYAGDGGPATAAELNQPYGVAVDAWGNLCISDGANNCIRVVTKAAGIISTIVGTGTPGYAGDGGPDTAAELYTPRELAFDIPGNLYIADRDNSCIREVQQAPN
jgi:hypothetical protein